mmetsp:Transcript_11284/g.27738  ORF Transcript_11284/g.27738 Transcript_11284/m.27738 type:complete len:582 (-) Transcript_11284:291-2036(-)
MNGLTTFVNGLFYTTADDGQTRPVNECLKIECGRDFEKCARWNTVFHYSQYNGGYETHETFWKGRKFQVLMVPRGKKRDEEPQWMKGEVVSWNEYIMGPGDRFCKWKLNARIHPSDVLGMGSLVVSPEDGVNDDGSNDDDDKVALITYVDDDDGKSCTLSSNRASSSIKCNLDELRPFCGTLQLDVHRMNVQGGGILKCSDLTDNMLSMKWTEPVSVEGEDGTEYHRRWHFDPEERRLDPESLANLAGSERVAELRAEHLKMIEEGPNVAQDGEQKVTKALHNLLVDEIIAGMEEGGALDVGPFQHALLSVPFPLYWIQVASIAKASRGELGEGHPLLELELTEDERCLLFCSLVDIGLYLRNDADWSEANSTCREQFIAEQVRKGHECDAVQFMDLSICRVMMEAGQWFQEEKEYRAAVWTFSLNLDSFRDGKYTFPGKDEWFAMRLNNIDICNTAMDNLIDASKAFEEGILACLSADGCGDRDARVVPVSEVMENTKGRAKLMLREAKEWFGTSGQIVSFDTSSDEAAVDGEMPCSSCGAGGARKRCSACSMRYYCNVTCQSAHWKVHKMTCLGKLRGK